MSIHINRTNEKIEVTNTEKPNLLAVISSRVSDHGGSLGDSIRYSVVLFDQKYDFTYGSRHDLKSERGALKAAEKAVQHLAWRG